ncbi:MAG: UDP-N-acetylglucosamine 2-epimerase [Betaproteobacteria bacterium]|nr:UDP-N-acetylglucosamine 2-epimerase [Betaproteobacteria bacterium]
MKRRKICVVTGSRADYGLLFWLLKDIAADRSCQLQLVVTGMHLSRQFGLTYKAIEADGFKIDAKVDLMLADDTPSGTAKSISRGVSGCGAAFARLRPDMIVLLGDRFEIFSAALAALVAKVPVAHIAGGDTTEGAFDEALRHGITKMSHLHFVTNSESARRVRQLGENSRHIFNVGSPGIDYIKRVKLLDRATLEKKLGLRFSERMIVVTFHPATLEEEAPQDQFRELLFALTELDATKHLVIFTRPNADTGGRILNRMIDRFVANHSNAHVYASLGQQLYLSLLKVTDVMAGNSSSGLYEAPSFGTATVNIGDRQKGRLQARSVINCRPVHKEIAAALRAALKRKRAAIANPYGDGNSSRRIFRELKKIRSPATLVKKRFMDLTI